MHPYDNLWTLTFLWTRLGPCIAQVFRRDMAKHMEACPLAELQCPNSWCVADKHRTPVLAIGENKICKHDDMTRCQLVFARPALAAHVLRCHKPRPPPSPPPPPPPGPNSKAVRLTWSVNAFHDAILSCLCRLRQFHDAIVGLDHYCQS